MSIISNNNNSNNNTSTFLDFPFGIGKQGEIHRTDYNDHIKDEIIAVLLTAPGERVNLPEFGCGLKNIVFDANSEFLATLVDYTVTRELMLWLEDKININEVRVKNADEKLIIDITYTIKASGDQQNVSISI